MLRDLARRATIYLFPVYEMYRARWRATVDEAQSAAPAAQPLPPRADARRSTARATSPTPNADTLYSSAWLDLSLEPLFLTVPPVGDLYYSYAFIDLFTDNFAHRQPSLEGQWPGDAHDRRADAGTGDAPGDVTLVRAPTNFGVAARPHPGRRAGGARPRAHPAEPRAARDARHAQRAAHPRDRRADALSHPGAARAGRRLAGRASRRSLRPVRHRHAGPGREPVARARPAAVRSARAAEAEARPQVRPARLQRCRAARHPRRHRAGPCRHPRRRRRRRPHGRRLDLWRAAPRQFRRRLSLSRRTCADGARRADARRGGLCELRGRCGTTAALRRRALHAHLSGRCACRPHTPSGRCRPTR